VLREVCIALFSAVTVWIGLQVSLFAGFAALAAWLIFRRPVVREMLVISLSMFGSAVLMLLLFAWKGVLSTFLLLTMGILGKHYMHGPQLTPVAKIFKLLSKTLIS